MSQEQVNTASNENCQSNKENIDSDKVNVGTNLWANKAQNNQSRNAICLKFKTEKKLESITDYLQVAKKNFNYGVVYPGTILEEDLLYVLRSQEGIVIQTQITCLNEEFNDLDEYVYSARKSSNLEYNDQILSIINNRSTTTLKVAIKVPNQKDQTTLLGNIVINAATLQQHQIPGQIVIPIFAQVTIPLIICLKELLDGESSFIPLAAKRNKNSDCKIPFKNESTTPIILELDLLLKEECNFPFTISMNATLSIQANTQFMVVLAIRPKPNTLSEKSEYKQILILKVKNSSVHFSYPLIIKLY